MDNETCRSCGRTRDNHTNVRHPFMPGPSTSRPLDPAETEAEILRAQLADAHAALARARDEADTLRATLADALRDIATITGLARNAAKTIEELKASANAWGQR